MQHKTLRLGKWMSMVFATWMFAMLQACSNHSEKSTIQDSTHLSDSSIALNQEVGSLTKDTMPSAVFQQNLKATLSVLLQQQWFLIQKPSFF